MTISKTRLKQIIKEEPDIEKENNYEIYKI